MLKKMLALLSPSSLPGNDYLAHRFSIGSSSAELIAASSGWDGYVREYAVRRLTTFRSAPALAALVERLNDWVPQVRYAAVEGFRHYLCEEHVALLLQNLDLILSLRDKRRGNHQGATSDAAIIKACSLNSHRYWARRDQEIWSSSSSGT